MIIIFHKNDKVISISNTETNQNVDVLEKDVVKTFFNLAKEYRNKLIVWCSNNLKDSLNTNMLEGFCHHKLQMMSFCTKTQNYITDRIGYVESSSPFIKVNKKVIYPTWIMSSDVGVINSDVLSTYNYHDYKNRSFSYVLNSIAKKGQKQGLFTYSNPDLLIKTKEGSGKAIISNLDFFSFIKEHYKVRWLFIVFINVLIYEKKLLLFSLIGSLLSSKRIEKDSKLHVLSNLTNNDVTLNNDTIDVVIPTMGRKEFLYDVLNDLSNQSILPQNVIIVEQNPDKSSITQLDYIKIEEWPFRIKHTFTHKTGACNARNIALSKVDSKWCFLADDDIRFSEDLLKSAIVQMKNYSLKAATLKCLREQDEDMESRVLQWNTFGSGCSIVSKLVLQHISFNTAYEYGYGEDADFGMQIRNKGVDVGYLGSCKIIHLKAPIGGFRTKFKHTWEDDKLQPKPSPTMMLYNLNHKTKHQFLGSKTLLFLKFFKRQKNKNIFSYFFMMRKRWNKSVYLANQLSKSN